MRPLGGLLTAMVTPFRGDGRVNEEAAVALGRHLLANGSDGLVVCGTTGESPTLTDDEMVSLVSLMVEELGDEALIAAGAGSNSTHHACHLAERMAATGAEALLSVTGYYNRPNRRGIVRHYEEVARAAGGTRIIVYNIPSRTTVNLDPELLAELAQIDGIEAVKQSNSAELRPIDGMTLLTGNDEDLARCLDVGGAGGIHVSSHVVGSEMRRMFDEPGAPRRDPRGAGAAVLGDVLHREPDPGQDRAEPPRPRRRWPTTPAGRGRRLRAGDRALRPRTAGIADRGPRRVSGKLRVLPLGGVGEIGKNLTVVEYDDRIVVVDCGLRFPTAEMMGIDLVLPDFTYLRERVDDIEAFVITHGHEDHLGALPWVLRELGQQATPVVYGGQLTVAMARSKLDEHKLRDVNLEVLPVGQVADAGPFELELVHLTHSIPDAAGVALTCELGTILFTGDYKFDQTPVGGAPADMARLAELGREGLLLLCGDSTNADRDGISTSESVVGPQLERLFSHCPGRIVVTCFASNIHRVQQVVDAAVAHDRKVALIGRSMRKNVNIGRSLGHIQIPEGQLVPPRELEHFPDERLVIISTGSQGEPLSALRRMAYRDHPAVELKTGDTVVFSADADPGQRARRQRDDRPAVPHRLRRRDRPRRADPRLRPRVLGGAEDDAQPHAPALRDAGPRRLQADAAAQPARRGGRRAGREHLPDRERHAAGDRRAGRPLRRPPDRRARVRRRRRHRRRGRRRAARPPHAVGGRHLHHRRHGVRAGRLVRRPARGAGSRRAVPGRERRRSSTSCATRSRTRSTAPPSSGSPRSTCWSPSCTTTSPPSSTRSSSAARWCCRS